MRLVALAGQQHAATTASAFAAHLQRLVERRRARIRGPRRRCARRPARRRVAPCCCSRAARLTGSPVAIASPGRGAVVAITWPVLTPIRTASSTPCSAASSRFSVGQPALHPQRRPERAVGVVLVRDRHAERGHHGVADELLDRAALGLDLGPHRREEPAHHVLQRLGVEPVAELPSSRPRRRTARSPASAPRTSPVAGTDSGAPHSRQNFAWSGFSVPQRAQTVIGPVYSDGIRLRRSPTPRPAAGSPAQPGGRRMELACQPLERAVDSEQLALRPGLHDVASLDHKDGVGAADGGQPVGDDDRAAPVQQPCRAPARSATSVGRSMFDVASSRIRMRGSASSARAIEISWRSPAESPDAALAHLVLEPADAAGRPAGRRRSRPRSRARPRRSPRAAPKRMLSAIVPENRKGSCSTTPSWRR